MIFNILSKLLGHILNIFYRITFYKFPQIVSVAVIIVNENKEFLVQNRADGKGYCFPGGLSKVKEPLESAAEREVFEETGYKVSDLKLLTLDGVNEKNIYCLLVLYEGKIIGGEMKNSWEGKVEWKTYGELKGKMAFNMNSLLEKYHSENMS